MLTQLKEKVAGNFRESVEMAKRDTEDAFKLPLVKIAQGVIGLCGFVGAVVGLVMGFVIGSIIGALWGLVVGVAVVAPFALFVWLIPTPFAWLARRLGYA